MKGESRGSARAFVRSLNILLKFARLYEFGHARTASQFETAWKELRTALDESGGSGVLLGASGNQILLDGVPLGASAGERSFAQLLISSGIASIHFSPTLTQSQFARFVRAFHLSQNNSKPRSPENRASRSMRSAMLRRILLWLESKWPRNSRRKHSARMATNSRIFLKIPINSSR
jgi:hypothetical protein